MATHARVLDQRRLEALLERGDGPRFGVISALDGYRNPDGGYGWGLEPDLRAPQSQPAAALHAFEALAAAAPQASPHAAHLLDWLDRVTLADGGLPFALPIPDPSGCAPFWAAADPTESSLQITAAVAAQAHRAARHDDGIRAHRWLSRATRYCFERIRDLEDRPFAYVLAFSLQLLDLLAAEDAEARDLLTHLARFLPADGAWAVEGGAEGETVRVTSEPGLPVYELLDTRAVGAEIDRLAEAQQPDGGWAVDFDSYSPSASLEWRGYTTVNAIATLIAHGRR